MKKLMIYSTVILMVVISTSLKAQDGNRMAMSSMKSVKKTETKAEKKEIRKENRNLVSEESMRTFVSDFGNISGVQWERGRYYDEALFTKDGHQYKAFYDQSSKLVGTTTEKTFADLPKSAQKDIQKRFGDYTIDKVIFFEDNQLNDQDMLLYGSKFEDADNYFAELSGKNKNIVIQIKPDGQVFFFEELQRKI